jgi:hypothetical protein
VRPCSAVIDDVETAGDLLLHDLADGPAHRVLELARVGSGMLLLMQKKLHHLRGPRQASGMRGEQSLRAALHS